MAIGVGVKDLHEAAVGGHIAAMQLLLELGAYLNEDIGRVLGMMARKED